MNRTSQLCPWPATRGCLGAVAATLTVLIGCGGGVKALDPKDPTLPAQARQWVADAEDGVIAARVRLRRADAERAHVRAWGDDLRRRFAHSPSSLRTALARMIDANLTLQDLSVAYARAGERFAQAKYRAINAEQAVKLDTARYDLEALRRAASRAQDELRTARKKLWQRREGVEQATNEWWQAYAQHVAGGGDARALWIGDAKPIRVDGKDKADGKGKAKGKGTLSSRNGDTVARRP